MTRIRIATSALLAASLALPLTAQIQVQQGGGLDANQQVGSGGYNRIENQVDYQARNLLVTGNAAGGRSFQGDVGYTSAGDLRTNLGSDTLFNFNRDSVYSAPNALGIRAQTYGNRVIVTRASATTPGQFTGGGLGLNTRTYYDQRSGVVSFRQNSGGLVLVSGIHDIQDLSSNTNVLATIRTENGQLARIQASPLNGLQVNPLAAEPLVIDPRTNRLVRPNQLNQPPPQEEELDPATGEPLDDPNDRRINNRYNDPTQQDPNAPDADPNDPTAIRVGERVAPTLVLGNQLQQQMAAQALNGEVRDFDTEVEQLQQQMFGPVAQAQQNAEQNAPSGDPYADLIARIKAQAAENQPGQEPQPEEKPEDDDEGGTIPSWQELFEAPDQAVQDAVDRARDDAIRRALGMVDENGDLDRDTPLPSPEESGKLAELMDALNYDLPRVRTLAGDQENRLNGLMARGEQELAAGHFLAAENVYRQVLRETGDNPLAKAGLIHSQLGAGMIRSAAFNLRSLFSEHPELIALRYDAALLPNNDRLTWLQRELQGMVNDENYSAEPGLVMAYLGYQLEAEPLVTYGIALAEARAPRDPLMPILRQIWLEGEQPEAEEDNSEPEAEPAPAVEAEAPVPVDK